MTDRDSLQNQIYRLQDKNALTHNRFLEVEGILQKILDRIENLEGKILELQERIDTGSREWNKQRNRIERLERIHGIKEPTPVKPFTVEKPTIGSVIIDGVQYRSVKGDE